MDDARHRDLLSFFDKLVPNEGPQETAVRNLRLFRISESFGFTPMAYEPQIIIMVQGQKNINLGGETYLYDPYNYVVLSVPLPLQCEAISMPGEPALGLSIAVDPASVGEILLQDESIRQEGSGIPKGIYSAPLQQAMYDATFRLLKSLTDKHDSLILGPMIVREIIYQVLKDQYGWALQALTLQNRNFFQISRILQKIQKEFFTELNVATLAAETGMSPTTFHANFKHITGCSPIQYIKGIRLNKARQIMSEEGASALAAAHRVGYQSPSQFNREYKRLFGNTPAKDAVVLK